MNKEVLEELERPFELKARRGVGGKIFKYVPSEDIVARMNKVFIGNWNTEVMSSEIIEDNVLVCVRVYVTDNTNNKVYYHDGYSSHPLTRYTSGINKDKIIDVGNSYKSAVSKAIKTACTRWGVGLYLEESEDSNSSSDEIASTAAKFTTTFSKTAVTPTIPINNDQLDIPIVPTNNSAGVKNHEKMERPMPWPDPPEMGVEKNATKTNTNPVFTNDTIILPDPVGNMPDIPFNNQSQEGVNVESSVEKLTPVQQAAVEHTMDIHNIKFDELVSKALQRQSDIPSKIEDVSYLDAVTIIQYGNHLRPTQEQGY